MQRAISGVNCNARSTSCIRAIPTGAESPTSRIVSIELQQPSLKGLAFGKSGQAGMVGSGRNGFEMLDRAMSPTRDSLEDSVQPERRTIPVLGDEQDATRVQALDTAPQKRFEIST